MKQIIQNYRTGKLFLDEVPAPRCPANGVLVQTMNSLISIGTERSIIKLGQKSLLGKARERPDLMKRFIEKAQNEGFFKTFQEAMGRLDVPTALGYSSAGVVLEVGRNVTAYAPGDRVACIGAGFAGHAEVVVIPEKLCAPLPEALSFEDGAFGMLGIIALHGVRCARLTFGETVGVVGLGLLGLIAAQILRAYGCQVVGLDPAPDKLALARQLEIHNVVANASAYRQLCASLTMGQGLDAVVITAATKSAVPVNLAVEVARNNARIVLVGVADIHPSRNEMWKKEVEIIVSKAAGPGCLEDQYEKDGFDYPPGLVRWTENRNLREFLRLAAGGLVKLKPMITHRVDMTQAEPVYADMLRGVGGPYVGVVLRYSEEVKAVTAADRRMELAPARLVDGKMQVGVIGAGLFGKALLLPALRRVPGIQLSSLATASGPSAVHTARKCGFRSALTDHLQVLADPDIQSVVLLTPHSQHAQMVIEALRAGKHVFVEKPLCINEAELAEIVEVMNTTEDSRSPQSGTAPSRAESSPHTVTHSPVAIHSRQVLFVGYNRRFSPHSARLREALQDRRDPLVINYRVNAGFVPSEHWVHSDREGGSRIIGEVCHFVDWMQSMTMALVERVYAERVTGNGKTVVNSDNVVISLKFTDGSTGSITYAAQGDRSLCREQATIFSEGHSWVVSDYRLTEGYFRGRRRSFKTGGQQIGYREELEAFFAAAKGSKPPPISFAELVNSTRAVFAINRALETGVPVTL